MKTLDPTIISKIESFNWDIGEKEEFIEYLSSLTMEQKENMINKILEEKLSPYSFYENEQEE
jgi:hypothetical protein